MDENQLLKLMTSTIAAPMIKSAIDAEMNWIALGGDGKLPEAKVNQIVELAGWYAKKFLAAQ